jgi:succinate dehydrogenase / fumarate reductase cytochrome b subunit
VAEPYGGSQFRPYNAASTLGESMRGVTIPVLYGIGILACVFHLANGLWTMGITWGLWTSDTSQRRANWLCTFAGLALAVVGLAALAGAVTADVAQARQVEDVMYRARVASHDVAPKQHKRASDDSLAGEVVH